MTTRREFTACGLAALAAATPPVAAFADPSGTRFHEAGFHEKAGGNSVRCLLCPRTCLIPDGKTGFCRVRRNIGGSLRSLVYGYPCTVNNDPVEKKPMFHVYPGSRTFSIATLGCNITCKFCQNAEISQASPGDIRIPYRAPGEIAEMAAGLGSKTLSFTYNEPVIFCEYMLDCAKEAAKSGIGGLMISNGFINRKPMLEICRTLSAVKIDLKAFSNDFYEKVCGGMLQPVLDTLTTLADSGMWFEIVVLLIPTMNDSTEEIKRMSDWITGNLGENVPIHFTRFHPAYKLRTLPPTPVNTLKRARQTAMAAGCRFVYTGNMPGDEGENTYCPDCGETLVRRQGYSILSNRIMNGKCPACLTRIPGLWS